MQPIISLLKLVSGMTTKKIMLVAICFGFIFNGHSQTELTSPLDSLAGKFARSIRLNPHEKILIQTDKSFYLAGETLWFRGFSLNALSHRFTVQSKIMYVDLVDEQDHPISQFVLNIPRQQLEGNFTIPASLQEGYYWLRAYTRKILKEDSLDIAVIPIYVLNPRKPDSTLIGIKRPKRSLATAALTPKITFYPEGGSLISGTTTSVAFRAEDQQGNPLEISGYVTDSWDSVVTHFKTSMPGLGKFDLDIWKTRRYTAHIEWNGLKNLVYPLPQVNQYSTQLSVIGQNDNAFQVRLSLGDSLYNKGKLNYVIGVSRDSICFAATGIDMYELWIPKQHFPTGRATLLVFNENKKVVSERDIYIDRDDHVITIKTDKTVYGAREKATCNVTITDSMSKPVRALFVLSVTDDNMDKQAGLDSRTETVFLDQLDVPNGVRGHNRAQWDLIMMTQPAKFRGWNPYRDDEVRVSGDYLTDTSLQNVSGRIFDKKNRPVAEEVVTLFSTQKNILFISDTTDQLGRFRFRLPIEFPDSTQFTLQVANKKGTKEDKRIVVDSFPFPTPATPAFLRKKFDSARLVTMKDLKLTLMDTLNFGKGKEWLREVTVKGTRKKQLNYDEKKRISSFSHIVTADQLAQGIGSLTNAILMVPGITLRDGKLIALGGFALHDHEPLLVIDGVPVLLDSPDIGESSPILSFLKFMSPNTIDFIEFLPGPEAAAWGLRGAFGVISINTTPRTHYDDDYMYLGLKKIFVKGYAEPRSFIAPDYNVKEIKRSSYPDLRSTLFWNGATLTDANGKASLTFFTSDPTTTYTVSLVGITEQGTYLYKQMQIARK